MTIYENIKGFVPTSLVDWEGKVVCVIFVSGCNFRCSFCSNKDLVLTPEKLDAIPFEKIKDYLLKNRDFADGVVISGGEPTLYPDLPELCMEIKKLGFKVKIDTNGTNPDMLKLLLEKSLADYVAMDLKTSFEKYKEIANADVDIEKLKKSISIVSKFPEYEFRTTLFPKIEKKDLIAIADYLKKNNANKAFFMHQFRNETCINEEAEKMKPYSKEELGKLLDEIRSFFEKSGIRNA